MDLTIPGVAPSGPPTVRGLDLALTSTGVAGNAGWVETLKPPAKLRGHERMAWLKTAILEHVRGADLVVVEGPSYGSQMNQAGHHERAGLWWLITHTLWLDRVPVAVAPPKSVKKLATGKGNAGKDDMMLAAARRFDWFAGDNNSADALWLAVAGAEWLGVPMVALPQLNLSALDGIAWPPGVERLEVAA